MIPDFRNVYTLGGANMAEWSECERLIFETLQRLDANLKEIRDNMAIKHDLELLRTEQAKIKETLSQIDKNAAVNSSMVKVYTVAVASVIACVASIASSIFLQYMTG